MGVESTYTLKAAPAKSYEQACRHIRATNGEACLVGRRSDGA